jgi:hypothetical protein
LKTTYPPPAELAALIALRMAAVSSVTPSPLAPYEFTDAPTQTACATFPEAVQRVKSKTNRSVTFTVSPLDGRT